MAQAYSDDLRERVGAAVLWGRPCREIAATVGVRGPAEEVVAASARYWECRFTADGRQKMRRVLVNEQEWMLQRPAALLYDRIDPPCVLDEPINGQLFITYVEPCLVPILSPVEHGHHGQAD